ncbi:flavin reductase family protein [Mesorhizobium sp. ASY16-5R]|uniref:flavin reductase family protein n=1 Tax=Mesorhizobium sp. ASY16-5R TaxID=3445772 RepID=UPI003F9F0F7B
MGLSSVNPYQAAAGGTLPAALDQKAFRHCLGSFATGVTVVTAETNGRRVGVTANSFSSLSLDPPLILWSLRRQSSSLDAFLKASHFCVNVLEASQIALATRFASSGAGKFDHVDWTPGRGGAPILPDVAAVIQCRLYGMQEGGDHLIFLGEVEAFSSTASSPMAFVHGKFALAAAHPTLTPAVVGDFALGWG